MTALRIAAFAIGVVILIVNLLSVIMVMIVPRGASGLATFPMRVVRATFRSLARQARTYRTQDRILALAEPMALVAMLISWLIIALVGFAFLIWAISGHSWASSLDEAGSSLFTLGFLFAHDRGAAAVDEIAAATGMVLVATQIAYLPTLYSAYNQREVQVTLLEARAGVPAWGPELLARAQMIGILQALGPLFAEWERWGADVAESHVSYPSLLHLRSPRRDNHWMVSFIAVLDAAALTLALDPEGAPYEARLCIRMGFTALRDLAHANKIPYDPDPSPDSDIALSRAEFEDAYRRLTQIGFPTTSPVDEAWLNFKGWRVNYESIAYELAELLDAPPAAWSGPRRMIRGETMQPVSPADRRPSGVITGSTE